MYKSYRLAINDKEVEKILTLVGNHAPIARHIPKDEVDKVLETDDANWIMDTWFPQYEADIFLSHSHNDYELARKLATQFESVGLRVFIDSEVWGYANNLLKDIDNEYCVKCKEDDGSIIYSYERRNQTTAHINIILAHALLRMIDQTECFIFLETPNSASVTSRNKVETMSPWLFHELNITKIIEPKPIKRMCKFAEDSESEHLNESIIRFKFTADTTDMIRLSYEVLSSLISKARIRCNFLHSNELYGVKFLDELYKVSAI